MAKPKAKLTSILTVKVTPEQLRALQDLAEVTGWSVSELVRRFLTIPSIDAEDPAGYYDLVQELRSERDALIDALIEEHEKELQR